MAEETISFAVFYDPFLSLHTSKGWDVSQIVQGRVATVSGSRFNVGLPRSVNVVTAGELRSLICDTFNQKMKEASCDAPPPPQLTPDRTLLSWGTTIVSPDDRPLSSFGMKDVHRNVQLLLESFGESSEEQLSELRESAKRDNDRYLQAQSTANGSSTTLSTSENQGDRTPSSAPTLNEQPKEARMADRSLLLAAMERRMKQTQK